MYPLKKHKNLTIKWDGGWGVNSQGTPENNKEVFLYFFLDYFVWGDHKTFAIFRPGFDS